jgi:hypothetical protein
MPGGQLSHNFLTVGNGAGEVAKPFGDNGARVLAHVALGPFGAMH